MKTTVSMKVIVTINILTVADLTNGTRGIINNIILDHREHPDESKVAKGEVTFLYPPAMIVFKPLKLSYPQFNSLQQGEIPLFPIEVGFHISMSACKRVQIPH